LTAARPEIDDLYAAFVAMLPAALAEPALALAATLGLAPSPAVPWSEVFTHEITLGAPRLVAEAMPSLSDALVRDATLAHLLAVIEAFGTDRIEDGQVPETPALAAVLAHARRARDEALARVAPDESYQLAERETLAAIHAEQEALRGGGAVTFHRYLAISHGKQRVGLPASLALSAAAGSSARRARSLSRMLDDVWVALQLHDDVIDWEDDLARGGAWAVSLAAHAPTCIEGCDGDAKLVSMRKRVHQSGMLARMLQTSARRFRAARRRAEALGASRLASWARQREASARDLWRHEAESPGFANRAHALSAWARAVLP
jgi:hypothetical protein